MASDTVVRPPNQAVLDVVYSGISDLNQQLPRDQRIEPFPSSVLFGNGGTLDSMALGNLIVILEQKLESFFGFSIDLTQDDPFSPTSGHFRTIHSLCDFVESAAERGR